MVKPRIVTAKRIQSVFMPLEEGAGPYESKFLLDPHNPGSVVNPGRIYSHRDGPVIILCVLDTEVWFLLGGIIYALDEADFRRFLAKEPGGRSALHPVAKISGVEIHFLLGVISETGPLGLWSIIGGDPLRYFQQEKSKIKVLQAKIGGLLLVRHMLKRYFPRLYRWVEIPLASGVWAKFPGSTDFDDAAIARLAGKLVGHYESIESLETEINLWWSLTKPFFYQLKFTAIFVSRAFKVRREFWQTRIDGLIAGFRNFGAPVAEKSARGFVGEMKQCSIHMLETVNILETVFRSENKPPKHQALEMERS